MWASFARLFPPSKIYCALQNSSSRLSHQVSAKPMSPLFSVDEVSAVNKAAQCLVEGGVIALPTDTIYGLAAHVQNNEAIKQLYKIKGRDSNKPIAICVDNVDCIPVWGKVKELPSGLLETLLPGPVTVVLERTPLLNRALNPGLRNVGIRIPDYEFVRAVCKEVGAPLALTSANASNEPSSLSLEEFEHLWPHLSALFHNGRVGDSPELRAGSTVVDLSVAGKYKILRPGSALANTRVILKKFELTPREANGLC